MIYASSPQHEPGHPDAPSGPRPFRYFLDMVKKREREQLIAAKEKLEKQQQESGMS